MEETADKKLEKIIDYLSYGEGIDVDYTELSEEAKNNLLQIISPYGKYIKDVEPIQKPDNEIVAIDEYINSIKNLFEKIIDIGKYFHELGSFSDSVMASKWHTSSITTSNKINLSDLYVLTNELELQIKAFENHLYFPANAANQKYFKHTGDIFNFFFQESIYDGNIVKTFKEYLSQSFRMKNNSDLKNIEVEIDKGFLGTFISQVYESRNQFLEDVKDFETFTSKK